jgi:hypothetical protein
LLIISLVAAFFVGCTNSPSTVVSSATPSQDSSETTAGETGEQVMSPTSDQVPAPVAGTDPSDEIAVGSLAPVESAQQSTAGPTIGPSASTDDEVRVITFDDVNLGMEPDARFRPFMLVDRPAQDLIGKRVNLAGYINPTDSLRGITDFVLLRNLECKFGPGGQADHLVHVLMQGDASADFTDKTVYVEGELVLNPFHAPDGSATWCVFDLKADRVSLKPPVRRR